MTEGTINNDMTMDAATGTLLAGCYPVVSQLGQGGMTICAFGCSRMVEFENADGEYELGAGERMKMQNRREMFVRRTGATKSIQETLVTTIGLKRNQYWGRVQKIVTVDDLFKE